MTDSKLLLEKLEHWFSRNRRSFPWRETTDPYAIWVSEIMLQQTRTTAVLGYYTRFLQQFPSLSSLARADEDALLKAWEGLGYYSRARNLRKGAQFVLEHFNGEFPHTFKEACSIPGVGPYTAGAILSFAYGEQVPAVDGNAVRVLSRFLEQPWALDRAQDRKSASTWVEDLLKHPSASAKRFNEGLIELGALICLPKNPRCSQCPLQGLCSAFGHQSTDEYPIPKQKKSLPVLQRTVLLVRCPSCKSTLIVQRPKTGLLSRMWEFPCLETGLETVNGVQDELESLGFAVRSVQAAPRIEHRFTHRIWQLWGYQVFVSDLEAFQNQWNLLLQLEKNPTRTTTVPASPIQSGPLHLCTPNQLDQRAFGGGMEPYRKLLMTSFSPEDHTS